MRVNWVFADTFILPHDISLDQIKNIGPSWGSWRLWRNCGIDNAICHDLQSANDLIKRAFQAVCNFYIPKDLYSSLNRPVGVKLYDGEFKQDIDHHEDIVALHLASSNSDIVLMVGFDLTKPAKDSDGDMYNRVKQVNYHNLIKAQIASGTSIQYVAIDQDPGRVSDEIRDLPNFTIDTFDTALSLIF